MEGRFVLVISPLVEEGLQESPDRVREWFDRFHAVAEPVPMGPEAAALSQAYLDAGILTPNSAEDALHVALATIAECELLVSWNFRHLVHFQKIPRYNAVNILHRRAELAICSPAEVIEDED